MNKRILLTAVWICVLLVGFVSPAAMQSPTDITAVNPKYGTVGTQVTISGAGFGHKQGEVLIGAEKCKVLSWSDSEITCEVHKPQPPGRYPLKVFLQGEKEPAGPLAPIFFMLAPRITAGDPTAELVQDGNTVTIEGRFFGDRKGEVSLAYRDGEVEVESPKVVDWSMSAIQLELPEGLVGNFVLFVRNAVGADAALLDLGDGPPILRTEEPYGYSDGNYESLNNASGIYFKGKNYYFSLTNLMDVWGDGTYNHLTAKTFYNGQFNPPLAMDHGHTDDSIVPLVVGDKLWVFHTGYDTSGDYQDYIYYTTFDGATWESSWHRIGAAVTLYEVAPVYNPVTGRISVYLTGTDSTLYWMYSDDNGATWKSSQVQPVKVVKSAPSAVYFPWTNQYGFYDTLVAALLGPSHAAVYAIKDGVIISTVLDDTSNYMDGGRPFLMDDLGSKFVALIAGMKWGTREKQPVIRKLSKITGAWEAPYAGVEFPPTTWYQDYYFYEEPNGAVYCWPDGNRYFFLIYSYIDWVGPVLGSGQDMVYPVENLGPCPGPY